ncbi:hypothetical protein P4133_35115 [Pseudomonas aeruginosa]|nr:hypothetical protein [Pseudomonas aeruginosa]
MGEGLAAVSKEQSAVADGADNVSDGLPDMADTANTTAEAAEAPAERFQGWECWRRICHRASGGRSGDCHIGLPTRKAATASELNESIILTGNYAAPALGSWQRWPHRSPK